MRKVLLVFVTLLLLNPVAAQAYSFQFQNYVYLDDGHPVTSGATTMFSSTLESTGQGSDYQRYAGEFMIVDDVPGNSPSPVLVNFDIYFSGRIDYPYGSYSASANIIGPGVSISASTDGGTRTGQEMFLTNNWYDFEGHVYLDTDYGDEGWAMSSYRLEAVAAPTPIPGAVWLLGTGLVGLVGIRRKANA